MACPPRLSCRALLPRSWGTPGKAREGITPPPVRAPEEPPSSPSTGSGVLVPEPVSRLERQTTHLRRLSGSLPKRGWDAFRGVGGASSPGVWAGLQPKEWAELPPGAWADPENNRILEAFHEQQRCKLLAPPRTQDGCSTRETYRAWRLKRGANQQDLWLELLEMQP